MFQWQEDYATYSTEYYLYVRMRDNTSGRVDARYHVYAIPKWTDVPVRIGCELPAESIESVVTKHIERAAKGWEERENLQMEYFRVLAKEMDMI